MRAAGVSSRESKGVTFARQDFIEEPEQLVINPPAVELESLATAGNGRDRATLALKRLDGGCQGVGMLLGKPQAGRFSRVPERHHSLGGASPAEGQNGSTAGHRLDGDDPKILLAGEY